MPAAYIGLGSNLGDRLANLRAAVAALGRTAGVRVSAVSSVWETDPVGAEPPSYLNAVCAIETSLAPEALLDGCLSIEAALGRDRPRPGAPRTVDLDLLLYGNAVIRSPALTVPHPRMRDRRFVIEPLCELAPDLPHPLADDRPRDRLAALRAQPARRVAGPEAIAPPETAAPA